MKNEGRYEEAAEAFYQLYGYRDSYDQYQDCLNLAKEEAYQAAVAMMNEKRYDEAIERFRELKDYKDSADQIAVCQEQLRAKQYEAAVERMDAGDYAGAAGACRRFCRCDPGASLFADKRGREA